ncbi:MAG: amino acid ABC transporter substrate-binding protein [Turicibacter sp.]|nr:amino acid ABC transporter substrate-binding protein [Turicibacter sp.]
MKKKTLLAALGLFALMIVACSSGGDNTKEGGSPTLRIATEGTYAPFSYHDESGELTGYDVEVAKAVAEKIGYEAQFVEAPWDAMLAAFDANQADVVFNQVGITSERQEKYLFSDPYSYSHMVLVTNKDNNSIKGLDDLNGKNAAQSLTSNFAGVATEHGANLVSVNGFSQAVDLLRNGQADVTLNDDVAFLDYLKQQPDAPLKIVATAKEGVASAAMIHQSDTELHVKINEALSALRADGTLAGISEKFFGKDISSDS